MYAVETSGSTTVYAGGDFTAVGTRNRTQFAEFVANPEPTIALSSLAPDPVNGAIAVSAVVSSSTIDFSAGDLSVSNATVSGFSGSGSAYSFTLSPIADGPFSVSVPAAVFTDR